MQLPFIETLISWWRRRRKRKQSRVSPSSARLRVQPFEHTDEKGLQDSDMLRCQHLRLTVKAELGDGRKTSSSSSSSPLLLPVTGVLQGDRLRLELRADANVDTAAKAKEKELLRRLLDEDVALGEDVIGWREEEQQQHQQQQHQQQHPSRLWLVLAPTKRVRKKKKDAALLEYTPFSIMIGLNAKGPKETTDDYQKRLHSDLPFMEGIKAQLVKSAPLGGDSSSIDRSKPLLILLNPKSGSGRSPKVFHRCLEPMLREAGFKYKLVVTERSMHAHDVVAKHQNLCDYSGVVIVSGDGLLFEVVQAIMGRDDGGDARQKVAVGIVAGGSGNGLARSQLHEWGHLYRRKGIVSSSARVVRGRTSELDLINIKMEGSDKEQHAFLSFGVGFIADLDIGSEGIRWMGEARFTVWAVLNLVRMHSYRARVEYLAGKPICSSTPGECPGTECDTCWATTEDDFVMVYAVSCAYISSTAMLAPRAKKDDGLMWLLMIRKGISRKRMAKLLIRMETGKHTNMNEVELVPVRAVRYDPLGDTSGVLTIDGEQVKYGKFQAEIRPRHLRILD